MSPDEQPTLPATLPTTLPNGLRPIPPAGMWLAPSVEELQAALSQYDVLELIGRGGMGAVYKARQKSLKRLVAIKILPVDAADDELKFTERFKNEAFAMARLNHNGIVNVHDAGEVEDGLLYFVMEHVEGRDLAHEIADRGRLPQEEVRSIAMQVCDALGYLHSNGVIHRDIKPANILLDEKGKVKVADFGLARLDEPLVTAMLTRSGTSLGTADFMAPEARRAGAVVDHRADLFSLGVTIYQILTGELPHGMFKLPSQMLPEIDERFDDIICRALEPKPEDRYQSAKEMQGDLDAIGVTLPRGDKVVALPEKKPARSWLIIGGIAALLVVTAWVVFGMKGKLPQSSETETQAPAVATARGGVIDLLDLVDVKRDAIAGEWSRSADELTVKEEASVSTEKDSPRLQLPYQPPEEYDFEMEFTPDSGDKNVYQVLSAHGRQFSWVMDAGTNAGKKAGFENIDGKGIIGRTVGSQMRGQFLTNGKRHRSKVEVRKTGVRGFLDDEMLVSWGDGVDSFKSLDIPPSRAMRDANHLGIAVTSRALTIHKIEVREITGTGKLEP